MASSSSLDPRSYVDFEPRTEWFKGKDSDTIMIDVSGFKKEQLKVLINTTGSIKISGERPIEGRHWSRFSRSFAIPKNCNLKGIQAKFDGDEGLLYVVLPLSVPPPQIGAPTLPTQPQESAAVASTRQESTPPHAKYEASKMKEKMDAREEDEGGRISARDQNIINAGYGYKQDSGVVDAGRKYSGVASVFVLNKRKIILLSVILGVLISLGLAVYLSYRLKGL